MRRPILVFALASALLVLTPNSSALNVQASSGRVVHSESSDGCVTRVEAREPRRGVDLVVEEGNSHRLVIPMTLLVAIVECQAWPGALGTPREIPDPAPRGSAAAQPAPAPTWPTVTRSHDPWCTISICSPAATSRPVLLSP
jgi:hypothetical protein